MRICPNPPRWNEVFLRLKEHARRHPCLPPTPPTPLILAGWAYSNDSEKRLRWQSTVAWAKDNGCPELVELPDDAWYCVDEPATYDIGPLGGPMYRPWDFEAKQRPAPGQLAEHLDLLRSRWKQIAGPDLAAVTHPLAFKGAKARRLLVRAEASARPPWGTWSHLSRVESERRTFTRLRAAINEAIAPHEVDHVDFTIEPSSG